MLPAKFHVSLFHPGTSFFERRIWETDCAIPRVVWAHNKKAPGFAGHGLEPESDVEDVADDLARELLGEYMSGETWTCQSVVPYVLDTSQNISPLWTI